MITLSHLCFLKQSTFGLEFLWWRVVGFLIILSFTNTKQRCSFKNCKYIVWSSQTIKKECTILANLIMVESQHPNSPSSFEIVMKIIFRQKSMRARAISILQDSWKILSVTALYISSTSQIFQILIQESTLEHMLNFKYVFKSHRHQYAWVHSWISAWIKNALSTFHQPSKKVLFVITVHLA